MNTLHQEPNRLKARRAAPSSPPEAAPATLWDLFQSLQELTEDQDTVLLAVDDLLSRGLVRWAAARPPAVTLH
ncbi:MAG: hypothetical protein C4525_12500 [Desulfarculus sp.]|nr:MAG: hypothetical protein C4525_12500 [Desulfarculus sp.]